MFFFPLRCVHWAPMTTLTQPRRTARQCLCLCSSASATPHHGSMSARCDVIKPGQRAVLPPWCQRCRHPDQPGVFGCFFLGFFLRLRSLQDALNTRPVQRVFARVSKDNLPSFVQHKVASHLKNVLFQVSRNVREVSVRSSVFRVRQETIELHHAGVGRTKSKVLVNRSLLIQHYAKDATRHLQPQPGSLQIAKGNHQDPHRLSLQNRLVRLQVGHVVSSRLSSVVSDENQQQLLPLAQILAEGRALAAASVREWNLGTQAVRPQSR